jgi:RNA polymerase sigma-B factor
MSTDTSAAYGENLDEIAERYALERDRLGESHDRRLRDQLITEMLPFARRLAGRYRRTREPVADLEQVARLGLVNAVDRYDPGRGSFTAFAVATVTGELKRYFRDNTWGVHVPRRLQELTLAVAQAENALTVEFGRRPTDSEVARHCRLTLDDVADARRTAAGYRPVSLSQPLGESGSSLGDQFGAFDHAVELVPDHLALRHLIGRLPARERRILMERYYGNRTQSEIAADLGISQMHVSRLIASTLEWLRNAMLNDETPSWPGHGPAGVEATPVVTVDRERSGAVRILVEGEIDRDDADRLRQAILDVIRRARAGTHLVIDLSGVPAIDTSGLAVLLRAHDAARVRGVDLTTVGMRPYVRRLVKLTGLSTVLPTTSPRNAPHPASSPRSASARHTGPRRPAVHHVPRGHELRSTP